MAEAARTLLIWGTGGHGKVVADLVRALGLEIAGYIDRDGRVPHHHEGPDRATRVLTEVEIQGLISTHRRLPDGANAIALAIGSNGARWRCYRLVNGISTPVLIHPSSVLSPSASIGQASLVFARAVVNAGSQIGEAVIINTGAIIEHDCVVGDAAHVSPGAILTGGVRIGARSWVGAGATVMPGLTIGSDSIVGAGSLVRENVGDGITVVGVPARPIARRS